MGSDSHDPVIDPARYRCRFEDIALVGGVRSEPFPLGDGFVSLASTLGWISANDCFHP